MSVPNFSSLARLEVPEKFLWVGWGGVCKVIFVSNPTIVEVRLGFWQNTQAEGGLDNSKMSPSHICHKMQHQNKPKLTLYSILLFYLLLVKPYLIYMRHCAQLCHYLHLWHFINNTGYTMQVAEGGGDSCSSHSLDLDFLQTRYLRGRREGGQGKITTFFFCHWGWIWLYV